MAVELAKEFLAKEQTTWGEPTAVEQVPEDQENLVGTGGKRYRLVFQTSSEEIRVVGDRTILVNTQTGKVVFEPRD